MRASALALVAVSALTTGATAATDIEVVANSILRAYSDYCDPLYFDANRPSDTPVDPVLAESYARTLFVKYSGRCERFLNVDAAPAAIVPSVIDRVPELERAYPKVLTDLEVELLGNLLRFDDFDGQCPETPFDRSQLAELLQLTDQWREQLGRDDALVFARGYTTSEVFARLRSGIPSTVSAPCQMRELVAGQMMLAAINSGLIAMPDNRGGMSTEDRRRSTQPDESSVEASPEPDTDDGGGYVWEPGDPATKRGEGDEPMDLTQYVAPSDIAAIKPFTGVWGSTDACDEGQTYLIGQFDRQDGELQLGRGVPRISTKHLACEAGQWSVTGDISTFSALCHPDGERAWSGTGTIRWVSKKAVQLFLLDAPQPTRLERCDNQPVARRHDGADTEPQVPLDLFGN